MKRLYFLTALIGLVFFTACQEDKKTDLVALDKFSKVLGIFWRAYLFSDKF